MPPKKTADVDLDQEETVLDGEVVDEKEKVDDIEIDVVDDAAEKVDDAAGGEETSGFSGKKALGSKEVIPFQWKVVGTSRGVRVTVYKSVEREDADHQFTRLKAEGHYSDLAVMDVGAKVEQQPNVQITKPLKSAAKPMAPVNEKKAGAGKTMKARAATAAARKAREAKSPKAKKATTKKAAPAAAAATPAKAKKVVKKAKSTPSPKKAAKPAAKAASKPAAKTVTKKAKAKKKKSS